jgi:hypothetical protein
VCLFFAFGAEKVAKKVLHLSMVMSVNIVLGVRIPALGGCAWLAIWSVLQKQDGIIRSAKQDDIYGASNIVLPCPGS